MGYELRLGRIYSSDCGRTSTKGGIITTIVVAVVKIAWAVEPAIFIAGVGTGAVVAYIVLKNRELALLRRS